MKTVNIAICDDESMMIKQTRELLAEYFINQKGFHFIFFEFLSAEELLKSEVLFDFLFIDIEMPGIDGISAARILLEKNKESFVFLITGHSVYLDDAFDISAFRFFIKPLHPKRLFSSISKALKKIDESTNCINVTHSEFKNILQLEIANILYIEIAKRKTHIVTIEHDFIIDENFKSVKEMIEDKVNCFAQCHQSFFVNLRYISDYNQEYVKLTYGDKNYTIHMSRRKYKSFKVRIFEHAKIYHA